MRQDINITAGTEIQLPMLTDGLRKAMMYEASLTLERDATYIFSIGLRDEKSRAQLSSPPSFEANDAFWELATALELALRAMESNSTDNQAPSEFIRVLKQDQKALYENAVKGLPDHEIPYLGPGPLRDLLLRLREHSRTISEYARQLSSEGAPDKVHINPPVGLRDTTNTQPVSQNQHSGLETICREQQREISALKGRIYDISLSLEQANIPSPNRIIIGWEAPTNYCDPEPIYGEETGFFNSY